MAKKNVIMSSFTVLQGEKEIYAMATKIQLDKYVVIVCGEMIKKKEREIKEQIKKIMSVEYKDKKFVFQINKYIPEDSVIFVTDDIDKYHILTSMSQINKNEYYEESIVEKLTKNMKQKYMLQGYACKEAIIPEELRIDKPRINYDNKVFQQEVQHHADSRRERKELTNKKVTKK